LARVLVVDESESLSQALSSMLYGAGYEVSVTGQAALHDFDRDEADIVLLDLVLPGVSGAEVWRRLRTTPSTPIIMIADHDGEIGRLAGRAEGGGSSATSELVGRIQELLLGQSVGVAEVPESTLAAGPVRMDLERHAVTVDGLPVQLPLKEFQLLEVFLRNAGRVLTRSQLIALVWGPNYVGDTKTLDVHVKRLRAKLEPVPSSPRHIVNVRSLGFKFVP
jgi:two-component system response regulator RegX3